MILVAGSANMDYVVRVERHPRPGETTIASGHALHLGGKGANQAVAAARLGGRVRFAGCVGDDPDGAALRAGFARDGVDTAGLVSVGAATGAGFITVDRAGENAIAVSSGANALFFPERLLPAVWEGVRLLVLQLEVPFATVDAAARRARQQGAVVLLNAAPIPGSLSLELSLIDVLVLNEHEAAALAGASEPPSSVAEAAALARRLRQRVSEVVITLGRSGAVHADADGVHHQPAFAVTPVDTTGAGDAFVGAFAVARLERQPPPAALRFANAAGALATTRHGAQPSMPRRAEVERLLGG